MPPISRGWIGIIVGVAALVTNKMVAPSKLMFLPNKVAAEPWRIFTLFCYFGELLFNLVVYLFLISKSFGALEGSYVLDIGMFPRKLVAGLNEQLRAELVAIIEKNKGIDFAYFVMQIAVSVIAAVTFIFYGFGISGPELVYLGPILERLLLYIWCKIYPEQDFFMFAFHVRAKYAPWVVATLVWIFSQDYLDAIAAFSKSFVQGIFSVLRLGLFLLAFVWFSVGHTWWFVRYFLLGDVYNEELTETRKSWQAAYDKYDGVDPQRKGLRDLYQFFLLTLVIPPWYWVVAQNLHSQQREE